MYYYISMNTINHLKKIIIHKYNVAYYCFMCGLYWQGIIHDMSKFSFTEFWESVKYYQGDRSPIDACKEAKGYSMAWFHHKGRNKHHWEYWMDDFEKGCIPKKMPFQYALEMVCDYLGAGRAYCGKNFTMQSEWEWWQNKKKVVKMHSDTFKLVEILMNRMNEIGIKETLTDKTYISELFVRYEYSIINELWKANY